MYYLILDYESEEATLIDAYPRHGIIDELAKLIHGSIETVSHLTGQQPTMMKLTHNGKRYVCGVSGNVAILTDEELGVYAIACEVESLVQMGGLLGRRLAAIFETDWPRINIADEGMVSVMKTIDSRVIGWAIQYRDEVYISSDLRGKQFNMAIRGLALYQVRMIKAGHLVKPVDEENVMFVKHTNGITLSMVIREMKTLKSSDIQAMLIRMGEACEGLVIETAKSDTSITYPIAESKIAMRHLQSISPLQELSLLSGFQENPQIIRVPQWLGFEK